MSMSAAVISLPSHSPAVPQLQVIGGTDANKVFPVSRSVFMIGRLLYCELKLKHSSVSALHCVLVHTWEGLLFRDCNSETGTLVNGVLTSEQLLKDKDTIKIGPFAFEVQIPAGWPPSAANGSTPRLEIAKTESSSGEAFRQLREERRKTQAFVDEQLASVRLAREELRSEELAMEERLQAQETQLQSQQEQLAALSRDLEERESRLAQLQKEWSVEKEQRDREEDAWQQRQLDANRLFEQSQVELQKLEGHLTQAKADLAGVKGEVDRLLEEKSSLAQWLEEHRGDPERFAQQAESLRQQESLSQENATKLHQEMEQLKAQRVKLQADLQVYQDKNRELESARTDFVKEKAAFAQAERQLQNRLQEAEERHAQINVARATWGEERAKAEQELHAWVEEQKRSAQGTIDAERAARLKDISTLETQTLAGLLEWLVQTENFLTNSLDAARESRAALLEKRSRLVR